MYLFQKSILWLAFLSMLGMIVTFFIDLDSIAQALSIVTMASLAIGLGSVDSLKSYRYTVWILLAVVCGLVYPSAFLTVGNFDMQKTVLSLQEPLRDPWRGSSQSQSLQAVQTKSSHKFSKETSVAPNAPQSYFLQISSTS